LPNEAANKLYLRVYRERLKRVDGGLHPARWREPERLICFPSSSFMTAVADRSPFRHKLHSKPSAAVSAAGANWYTSNLYACCSPPTDICGRDSSICPPTAISRRIQLARWTRPWAPAPKVIPNACCVLCTMFRPLPRADTRSRPTVRHGESPNQEDRSSRQPQKAAPMRSTSAPYPGRSGAGTFWRCQEIPFNCNCQLSYSRPRKSPMPRASRGRGPTPRSRTGACTRTCQGLFDSSSVGCSFASLVASVLLSDFAPLGARAAGFASFVPCDGWVSVPSEGELDGSDPRMGGNVGGWVPEWLGSRAASAEWISNPSSTAAAPARFSHELDSMLRVPTRSRTRTTRSRR